MAKQRIFELDSQLLTSIQACLQKTQYQFIENIVPMNNAEALERGGLMHDLIEMYYGVKGNSKGFCINSNSKTWISVIEAGMCDKNFYSLVPLRADKEMLIKFIQVAGEMRATKLELGMDTCMETIDQFSQYARHYKQDAWAPLMVEESGSKILYEDENIKILYTVKIDRVMQNGNLIAPFDTKTGQRNTQMSSMSNQFIGYCWFLGVDTLIVDKIGFQKTLKPHERFLRHSLKISTDRQEEWVENSVRTVFTYLDALDTDTFPKSIGHQCDSYSGCAYRLLCEASPMVRKDIMIRNYKIRERWDPSSHLGKGKKKEEEIQIEAEDLVQSGDETLASEISE